MWIQVRSMDGKDSTRVDGLSKLSKIEDLRSQIVDIFKAPADRLRLFCRGKQLEDGYTLFDYNVGLNDLVQVLVRQETLVSKDSVDTKLPKPGSKSQSSPNKENESPAKSAENSSHEIAKSKFYKIGDRVDAKADDTGAWFEAKITDIKVNKNATHQPGYEEGGVDDGLLYTVIFEDYEDEGPSVYKLKNFRPRACRNVKFEDVQENSMVMINYNVEKPKERGYWYDGKVTKKIKSRTSKELIVTIFIGMDAVPLEGCSIPFPDEVIAIEKHKLIVPKSEEASMEAVISRKNKPKCTFCKDATNKRCKFCSCHVCGGKEDPDKQILCDECDKPYHIWCLSPPLGAIPDVDEWYCPSCKNDETEVVNAGEKLKTSKKKSKMASATSSSSRDWGKGMACVGRTKECTIVPPNHFGPIPGVEVGTLWKFRVQVSEYGVHRPHVAGIHGREAEGAYSIVLSGGYEDDVDYGEEFHYTGSGGRDLSGNKRTAEQSCDQTLTRMNRALALNCAAPINAKTGAEAKDWKAGKPVRVVRNCKGSKHSKYCPVEGNRYDGIYKIVKYWSEKGKSGYLVWRYLLRRDDTTPAPWTKAGKERIKNLGLTMQYPEGYVDPAANKSKEASGKKNKRKSKIQKSDSEEEEIVPSPKKHRMRYVLPSDVQKLIEQDKNKRVWDECKKCLVEGSQVFLKKVEESFLCICCQDVVSKPVTTDCLHNVCKSCLVRSFKAKVYNCPLCRNDLGQNCDMNINKPLEGILLKLFPGYDAGR